MRQMASREYCCRLLFFFVSRKSGERNVENLSEDPNCCAKCQLLATSVVIVAFHKKRDICNNENIVLRKNKKIEICLLAQVERCLFSRLNAMDPTQQFLIFVNRSHRLTER